MNKESTTRKSTNNRRRYKMNPEEQGPQPFKAENDVTEREYEVLPNGDVKYTMHITKVSYWHANQFDGLLNENKMYKEKAQELYSEEHIAKLKKEEKSLDDEIAIMQPLLKQAQELTQVEYKKMRHEGMLKNLRNALDDDDKGLVWFENVWMRTKSEIGEKMEVKSIKEQWKEMQKLYKISGFKAVDICMNQYCKEISKSVIEAKAENILINGD